MKTIQLSEDQLKVLLLRFTDTLLNTEIEQEIFDILYRAINASDDVENNKIDDIIDGSYSGEDYRNDEDYKAANDPDFYFTSF